METSWLRLTLCQLMLPSQAWSRLAQAGVMGLVLGLPRLPDTSHWQIIETTAAGGDGGLVMAAVHSGGSILYSPLSVVTLTTITQLINIINYYSGVMLNQEQIKWIFLPGLVLGWLPLIVQSGVLFGVWALLIYPRVPPPPRDGDNAEMMRILLISSLLSSSGPGEETRALQFSHWCTEGAPTSTLSLLNGEIL